MTITACVIVGIVVVISLLQLAREVRKALDEISELPGGIEEYQPDDDTQPRGEP